MAYGSGLFVVTFGCPFCISFVNTRIRGLITLKNMKLAVAIRNIKTEMEVTASFTSEALFFSVLWLFMRNIINITSTIMMTKFISIILKTGICWYNPFPTFKATFKLPFLENTVPVFVEIPEEPGETFVVFEEGVENKILLIRLANGFSKVPFNFKGIKPSKTVGNVYIAVFLFNRLLLLNVCKRYRYKAANGMRLKKMFNLNKNTFNINTDVIERNSLNFISERREKANNAIAMILPRIKIEYKDRGNEIVPFATEGK